MYRHKSNIKSFPIVLALLAFYMVLLTSCGEKDVDISLMPDMDTFYQSASINNKIDILFVVDNSGSMAEEQANLASNFNAFISEFTTKSYDYRIGVVGTDAWKTRFGSNCNVGSGGGGAINVPCARLRDGQGSPVNHSGVFIIDNNTLDPVDAFNKNVKLGTGGTGDERAFDSFMQAFELDINPNNAFRRSDAFLAIVIVSDEDDFSHDNNFIADSYGAHLHSVQSYVSYLDNLTNSTETNRRYNVSTIAILDDACLAQNPTSGTHKGTRYMQLADATDGIKGSICDASFANSLNEIQTRISELSTQFYLSRRPDPSSIVVRVNGVVVLQSAVNGWTYNATANSIVFHGTAIPAQGAAIQVDFDPIEI